VDSAVRHLGLDLGGTNIKRVVLENDRILERDFQPTRSEDGVSAVLDRLASLARQAGPVDSVGVALPGLVDGVGRAVLLPNLYGDWIGQPIAAPLSEALERPVRLINDGHAFALAEARVGAARGADDVLCVVCGTGIGGGLVIGGRLHLGVEDRGGEIGHHTVVEDGPLCRCGNRGCLEMLAGARAIAAAAGQPSFDETAAAARGGDERAVEALRRAGVFIGIAVANLTIFLTPQRIVVGGGVAEADELLLGPLRAEVEKRAGGVAPLHAIEIVRATLGADAGAVGAALAGAEA
jgi:glucokinase